MSVLVKNKQRLTPRQHAQRVDRFKFHRVIKVLRQMEEKEMNLNTIMNEEYEKKEEEKIAEKLEQEKNKKEKEPEPEPTPF